MNKHLFKLLFGALFLVAATAFTGCNDDDDKNSETPKLSVSTKTLNFTDGSETTQTVDIKANCGWKVVKTSLEWATVTPAEDKGNGKIAISVTELPAGTTSRTGKISFTLVHPEFGPWGEAEGQTITVTQSSGDTPTPPVGEALYSENAGTATFKKGDGWPYVDKYDKWTRGGTLDQSGVTYAGSSSSVRCSGDDYEPNAADDISGAPYVVVKTFEIKNINIASNRNFTFTFVAQNTASTLSESPFTPTFGDITASSFNFSVSMDGTTYSKVAFVPVKSNSSWYKCTAQFKLPAAATTSTISVRFDGFNGGTTLRTDDFNLYEGGNGTEIGGDDPGPIDPTQATIADVIGGTVGNTFTTQGQIVAINGRSFLIQDATGRMLVYQGWDNDAKKPVYDYAASIGQTVKVTGKTTTYSKLVQFSEEGLSVEKVSDGTFTQPAPEKFDGPAFDAYKAATPVVKYIEYTGTLTIDGFYYNIAVDGTSLQGSLAYPADGFVDASLNGQPVTVCGYTLGMTNGAQMLSTIAVSVVKAGDTPSTPSISVNPASLSFAAAGEAKDVTITKSNADDCTIEASSDNGQFTAAVSGTKVTVTAKENTTAAAIKGTLTVKLMKNGSAVDTKTVALSQAAKSQGGGTETTVTMSFADIKAGGKEMPVNTYGSQNVTDPSTWYTWSKDGLDFAGARICEANAADYVGTLQMQGNASDANKQGFFGNATDLGKITKIVVVSKNTKYSPTEHLYMGTEANPTGNAQTSTIVQDGQMYTETFDIQGDYGFFKLHNDKQGAFYVQSISITYTK